MLERSDTEEAFRDLGIFEEPLRGVLIADAPGLQDVTRSARHAASLLVVFDAVEDKLLMQGGIEHASNDNQSQPRRQETHDLSRAGLTAER